MSQPSTVIEQGLLELSGPPGTWIWALTCPIPDCDCRSTLVLSLNGSREALLERGKPIAAAWLQDGDHAAATEALAGLTCFAVDLDTLEVFSAAYKPQADNDASPDSDEQSEGGAPLDLEAHPAIKAVAERLDDQVLESIAALWYRGKGLELPPEPGLDGAPIPVEEWEKEQLIDWHSAHHCLRADLYVQDDTCYEVFEMYCVETDCSCKSVSLVFSPLAAEDAGGVGLVEFDGTTAELAPEADEQRERLGALWEAFCTRHAPHQEYFARRCAVMHGFAGRFVATE